MRKRYVTFRVSDAECQTLKTGVEQAGTSVPMHARRLALNFIQLAPRLDTLERLIRDITDRSGMVLILVYLTTCTGIRWPLQARLLVLTIG